MKRRNFIAGLAGAAALRPFASRAQRTQRSVPLVGVIWIGTASAQIPVRIREALLRGLRENGYDPDQVSRLKIVWRWAGPIGKRCRRACEAWR